MRKQQSGLESELYTRRQVFFLLEASKIDEKNISITAFSPFLRNKDKITILSMETDAVIKKLIDCLKNEKFIFFENIYKVKVYNLVPFTEPQ